MKKIFSLFSVFVLAFSASAQLLWRVTYSDASSPSYVFGTHHAAPLSICDSIDGFVPAFEKCERLLGEVDMTLMATQEAQSKMMKAMLLPPDSLLETLYTPAQYKMLNDTLLKYVGVEAGLLNSVKPAAISAQLAVALCQRILPDFSIAQQLDGVLQQRAREAGKQVDGLETIDFQIDLLFNRPIAEQAADLLRTVEGNSAKEMQMLCEAYMKQDLPTLQRIIEADASDSDAVRRLIDERNRNWAATIVPLMRDESLFIVVGAGHLTGENGLLALLRKTGCTIEAMK